MIRLGKRFITWEHKNNWTYKDAMVLAEMGHYGSDHFVSLTKLIADYYEVPHGIGHGWTEDDFGVNPNQFCPFVEKVFSEPVDLLYSWAQQIAGMYEIIKDQRFHWWWQPSALPPFAFSPRYLQAEIPENPSREWMGQPLAQQLSDDILFEAGNRLLARMEKGRGTLFVGMGRLLNRTGLGDFNEGVCTVDARQFSAFVENTFESGGSWYEVWDWYAAGMYEVLHEARFEWNRPNSFDLSRPIYSGVTPPEKKIERRIGERLLGKGNPSPP